MIEEYDRFYTDDPHRWTDENHDRAIFETLKAYGQPARLLDVGCGNGHTLELFSRYWKDTDYHGLDLSCVAVELARARLPRGTFTACDFLDYESAPYQTITMIGTLEHFEKPLDGLKKAKDLLTNDGILYVEVPNCIAYSSETGEEGFMRVNTGSRQIEWHLLRSSWERLIEESGMTIEKSITGESKAREFIWLLKR